VSVLLNYSAASKSFTSVPLTNLNVKWVAFPPRLSLFFSSFTIRIADAFYWYGQQGEDKRVIHKAKWSCTKLRFSLCLSITTWVLRWSELFTKWRKLIKKVLNNSIISRALHVVHKMKHQCGYLIFVCLSVCMNVLFPKVIYIKSISSSQCKASLM